ncbi:MAG: DUF5060 domain-containing protein [Acidimicrobiales bacterium]
MRRGKLVLAIVIALAAVGAGLAAIRSARSSESAGTADSVPRMGVWELTLNYPTRALANPWEDVSLAVTLTTPANDKIETRGFYYGPDTYKARFTPVETGEYSYSVAMKGPDGERSARGRFRSTASKNPGFVRPAPGNPSRLVLGERTPFNAIGINECLQDDNGNGRLDDVVMDGGLRPDGHAANSGGKVVDINTYLRAYGVEGARFNLLRWNPGNCSFPVVEKISVSGNRYVEAGGRLGDELLSAAKAQGFRILFTFFYRPAYPNAPDAPDQAAALRRYVDYAMARYGPYVDIWELTNESIPPQAGTTPGHGGGADAHANLPANPAPVGPTPPGPVHPSGDQEDAPGDPPQVSDEWLKLIAEHVRSKDPYRRMLTNSSPRQSDRALLDIRSPHWYETESELRSDTAIDGQLGHDSAGMPVVFGEQGNNGLNWDPLSARRLGIRSWTAFFKDAYLVFWNLSFAKDCKCQGVYLGPEERSYVRSLQRFADGLTADRSPVPVDAGGAVRGYGLRSGGSTAVYLHHFSDHSSTVSPLVRLPVAEAGVARWIDPATGEERGSQRVARGDQTLRPPPFNVDIALRISPN